MAVLSKETLHRIKQMEQSAYQDNLELAALWDCENWAEVAEYCDCTVEQLRVYLFDHSYMLCAEHEKELEIVDLASTGLFVDLRGPLRILEQYDKPLIMYCRETTSYPILKYMDLIGKIMIMGDEPEIYEGERFHDIRAITAAALQRGTVQPVLSGEQEYSQEEER